MKIYKKKNRGKKMFTVASPLNFFFYHQYQYYILDRYAV